MEHLSSGMEHHQEHQDQQVQWRRDKVQELCSQREISHILQVGLSTVNRDYHI